MGTPGVRVKGRAESSRSTAAITPPTGIARPARSWVKSDRSRLGIVPALAVSISGPLTRDEALL